MIIEDQELRTLFQAESEEHLQNLDEGLLRLETNPTDARMLDALFRSAHSLKGSAGMLGVTDVEQLAHRFEDALGSAKHGAPLAPDTMPHRRMQLQQQAQSQPTRRLRILRMERTGCKPSVSICVSWTH
jgi:chemotaxis protein histidine kinase CheA